MINTPYAWHWEATYPQVYGYTDDPNQHEQVNVSVAQNLRQSDGHGGWNQVAAFDYRVQDNQLHLAIGRTSLGLSASRPEVTLDFKWLDNVKRPADVMDWYTHGDVAPEGRFRYRYLAD